MNLKPKISYTILISILLAVSVLSLYSLSDIESQRLMEDVPETSRRIENSTSTVETPEVPSTTSEHTDNSSQQSNLQTYHNPELGITFQYPKGWFVDEVTTKYNNRIYIGNQKFDINSNEKSPDDYILVWIDYRKPSPDHITYDKQITELDKSLAIKKILHNKSVVINTYEYGYDPEREGDGFGPRLTAVWTNDIWIYHADTMDLREKEGNVQRVALLKQILSTLEFKKQ